MSNKKKVAIFKSDLLYISETFIRDQASALATWQPVLVGFREVEEGLTTPNLQRVIVPAPDARLIRSLRFWLSLPDPRLINCLRHLQVNLVHAHFGLDATDIWPSVKAAGLPMLVTLHGYDINIHREWWEAGYGGLRRRVYPSRLLRMAHDPSVSFIAVSKAIWQRAIDYGIPEDKITVSYIGIDAERFKPGGLPPDQRRKRIIFVGRMIENKSPLLMIKIFAQIREHTPGAELTMIGDGPLFGDAQQLAVALRIPVTFLGAVESSEVIAQLNQARVLCLPTSVASNGASEALGLVILEAQACGLPVVISSVGGAKEGVLNGQTGYICEENSISEFANTIALIINNDSLGKKAFMDAPAFIKKNFDIRWRTKDLEALYERAIGSALPT